MDTDKKKNINYDEFNFLINIDNIYEFTKEKLLYLSLEMDEISASNLYFQLLGLLIKIEKLKDYKKIAYISNLISFYLFDCLTPPFAKELAIYYAQKSIENNPNIEYKKWLSYVNKGN